jgi:small subunit ribosomal protein S17e
MGRIKTKKIKRETNNLMEKHGDSFTTDFEKNKQLVSQYADIPSKKIRNVIAGYVTRLVKSKE